MLDRIRTFADAVLHRPRRERDLDEELRVHLEMEAASRQGRGLDADAARSAAERAFGGVEQVKEAVRDSWGTRALDASRQDIRVGLRGLRRSPGYTAVVLLTLALGIGATTAIFSLVRGVLLRPLPYPDGARLVQLHQPLPGRDVPDLGWSYLDLQEYRSRSQVLTGVSEYHQMWFNLIDRGEPERVQTGVVSSNYFDLLGMTPILGRGFEPSDDVKGAEPVLLLSHGYWQRRHGADPAIVGRSVEMNDRVHTVVGVLPALPEYLQNDVYMTTVACPFRSRPAVAESRRARGYTAIARVQPGVSVDAARADLERVAADLGGEMPDDYPVAAGYSATLTPVKEALTGAARPRLLLLLAMVILVQLLVCANVTNLSLARLVRREGELALRAAIGATRGRLLRQLLTESTLLALGGGLLGLLLAWASIGPLVSFAARLTPRAAEVRIDGGVLLFLFAISVLTGLACGVLPAFGERADLAARVREGGERLGGATRRKLRDLLVVAQVGVSFLLLVAAGVTLRSLRALERVDPGFDPEGVLAVQVDLDWSRFTTAEARGGFFNALLERARELPGARGAAVASTFPLNDSNPFTLRLQIEGQDLGEADAPPAADLRLASPDYFEVVGSPLLRGRAFSHHDQLAAPAVAIVNAAFVRRHLASGEPLGRRLSLDGGESWITIVGVVADSRQYGLDQAAEPEIVVPVDQTTSGALSLSLLVRSTGDPMALVPAVRAVVRSIEPLQPIGRSTTLARARQAALASPRLTSLLLGMFALVAAGITAAGVTGVVAYTVSQRTIEFGVRMALGASPVSVGRLVLRQSLALVGAGLGLGLVAALVFATPLSGLVYGVTSRDPATLAAVALLLLGISLAACLVPVRRAGGGAPPASRRSWRCAARPPDLLTADRSFL